QVDLDCTLDNVASFSDFQSILIDRLRGVTIAAERIAQLRGPVPPGPSREARAIRTATARMGGGAAASSPAARATGAASEAAPQRTRVAPPPMAAKAASLAEAATTLAALDRVAFKRYVIANKFFLWPFLCQLIPDWWFCWQELGEVAIQ